MKHRAAAPARRALIGTTGVFLADMLMLPTGLFATAYLTRRLGPEGYGLFILAATVVAWAEWSVTSMFSRSTIKFVGEAQDWRPVGAAVVWLHLLTSTGAMLLLALLAGPLSTLLHEPRLANYLRLFSLDIPLFALAQAHRNILVGIGGFRERALTSAGRWISRLVFIVLLVQLGFSVYGAILGSIAASLVELSIGRIYVRPSLWRPADFSVAPLWVTPCRCLSRRCRFACSINWTSCP
jgi:O-antigen/teichoic acid export membrane protein